MCWKCNVIGAIVDKIKSKQIGRMPTKKNFPSIFANFFLFFRTAVLPSPDLQK